MTQQIPGLVRAQVAVHHAETLLHLAEVKDELDRSVTSLSRSRVLRGLQEQLEAQLGVWEYVAELLRDGGHYQAYQEANRER